MQRAAAATDLPPALNRITDTSASPATVVAQRREIARIVAREGAETLVGRARGIRVEVVGRLVGPVADHVAGRFVRYDRALGEVGLRAGSAWIVDDATGGLAVQGREHVPVRGPLLIVANHPGLSDVVAILAAAGRDDAWIVAAEYPFLRALRLANRRFLFVSDDRAGRLSALHRIVATLRRGEAVVAFPAGGIEVDPAVSRVAALASLARWSRSAGLLAREASGTLVVPTLVRGVVSRSAFDHPLARRRAALSERQRVATLLQLTLPSYRANRVQVSFACPITPGGAHAVHAAVLEAMRALVGPA